MSTHRKCCCGGCQIPSGSSFRVVNSGIAFGCCAVSAPGGGFMATGTILASVFANNEFGPCDYRTALMPTASMTLRLWSGSNPSFPCTTGTVTTATNVRVQWQLTTPVGQGVVGTNRPTLRGAFYYNLGIVQAGPTYFFFGWMDNADFDYGLNAVNTFTNFGACGWLPVPVFQNPDAEEFIVASGGTATVTRTA